MSMSESRMQRDSKQHRRDVLEHMHRELATARISADPWSHLERAHILSQPWAWPHTRVHAVMLRQAVRDRDVREVMGQLLEKSRTEPEWMKAAPYSTPVRRLDDVKAARDLDLAFIPPQVPGDAAPPELFSGEPAHI